VTRFLPFLARLVAVLLFVVVALLLFFINGQTVGGLQ